MRENACDPVPVCEATCELLEEGAPLLDVDTEGLDDVLALDEALGVSLPLCEAEPLPEVDPEAVPVAVAPCERVRERERVGA